MKQFILTILAVTFSCVLANAQIEKGTVFLGTSTTITGSSYSILTSSDNSVGLTFSSMKWSEYDEKEEYTILNFSPKLGYFVANNLVIGANVKLWTQKMEDSKTSIYGIGPFVRYYFTDGKIVPFAEAEATFSQYKDTWDSDYSDGEDKENLTMLALGGGVAFFINKYISVDGMIGYKTMSLKDTDDDEDEKMTINNFGLAIGFTVTF